jgi:two-component system cell cycle sensor histidine kinase/response regulator CckA
MGSAARFLPERVVLVVDDEDLVCHLAARILAAAGFHVEQAHSGAEAVARLAALDGAVQVVVSDISMPEMSGLKLAAEVAAHWPALPVVLMSAQGGPPADYPGPFLPKPFTADALVGAVSGFIPAQEPRAREKK